MPIRYAALAGCMLFAVPLMAATPGSVAEQYLFQAANAERIERGLTPLEWDSDLYQAATLHAQEMAARESISHQYPGEPELSARAQSAGARFSVVAENVGEAPSAVRLHDAWMNSPHHRANLLDPSVNRVAISVLRRDGQLYAVEDFERNVSPMSFDQQETAVASLVSAVAPLDVQVGSDDARQTCATDTGYAGERRPWFVMRFTTSELNVLPEQLKSKLSSGKYQVAAIGACSRRTGRFASYNIAVMLYP